MHEKHLKFICTELQLGPPQAASTRVYGSRGGSLMWRINTEKGSYAIKQLAPAIDLRAGSGLYICIINIGSIAGFQSKKYALPFCVSKAGMYHLTRIMAYELVDYGIRVNGISPGLFPTEHVTDYIASEAGKIFIQQIPLKRPGKYQELDGALLLLASDNSSYMTGSIIEIDGGFAIDIFLREDFEGDKTNAFFTPK